MERYWIRNRGRVQGPFTIDRIQGLLKRGRFNRHYHVSEDKKEWFPATDFPELFEGVISQRGGGGGGGDDDEVFQGGGSPFDDDFDAPPAQLDRPGRGRKSQSPFDDDDDEDDWEDDDEDWEDDEVGEGLIGWVESHSRPLLVVLVVALCGLSWFLFFRESFAQDEKDLQALIEAKSQVDRAAAGGIDPGQWSALNDQLSDELGPMIERLDDTASSQDHVKQQLLFGARDDLNRMFREIPNGQTGSLDHLEFRLRIVSEMIEKRERLYDGPQYAPKQPTPVAPPQAPADPNQMGNDQPPPNGAATAAPNGTPPGNSPPANAPPDNSAGGNMQPGDSTTAPMTPSTTPTNPAGTPMTPQPNNSGSQPPAAAPSGIPGRPPSVFQQQ